MHLHQHHHCAHTLAYCSHCDVAYCTACSRQWGAWTFRQYPQVTWTSPYGFAASGTASTTLSGTAAAINTAQNALHRHD